MWSARAKGKRPEVRGRLLRQRQSRPADGAPSGKDQGPKEPESVSLDLEALVEQLRKSPELANTLAALLASAPSRKIVRKNRISKSAFFISKAGKIVRSQLAGIQRKMYKIVPAERQKRSNEMITKNRCKPSKKRLTAVIFGTPGWVRTSGLSLRRRPLYPTELRGLIQKIFNFAGLQDSNDSIFRRRTLYPGEVRGHFELEYCTAFTQRCQQRWCE